MGKWEILCDAENIMCLELASNDMRTCPQQPLGSPALLKLIF